MPEAPGLSAAIEEGLARNGGPAHRVVGIRRRPFAYRTSFPLEEMDVWLDDGTTLSLVLKDPHRDALTEAARRAKPAFLHDPQREIEIYRSVLPTAPPGPPIFYGTVVDPETGRCCLLLERIAGRELYQVGEFALWEEAARWLSRLHSGFAGQNRPPDSHLIVYDTPFLRIWPQRAVEFAPPTARTWLAQLAERYDRVTERLAGRSPTLLHGEFYASNVLIQESPGGTRVCPVDWEMAGWGPDLLDLAAITAGQWTDYERAGLVRAYHEEMRVEGSTTESFEELLDALDYFRLHLAVQWLGWSADWSPPVEHAHDWLDEAQTLAEKLGI